MTTIVEVPHFELVYRRSRQTIRVPSDAADRPDVIATWARDVIGPSPIEKLIGLWFVCLKPIGHTVLSIGGVSGTTASPSDIFRAALLAGADSMALAHNHPSGTLEPSESDLRVTRSAASAARLLGLMFVDHVIVTHSSDHYYSMYTKGDF